MFAKDLRSKTLDELKTLASECSANLRDMRFKLATHQLKKTSEVSALRTYLARVKTVLRELTQRP